MTVASPPIGKAEFASRIKMVCRQAWSDVERNWDRHMADQNPSQRARKRFQVAVTASLLPGIDFYIFDEMSVRTRISRSRSLAGSCSSAICKTSK